MTCPKNLDTRQGHPRPLRITTGGRHRSIQRAHTSPEEKPVDIYTSIIISLIRRLRSVVMIIDQRRV